MLGAGKSTRLKKKRNKVFLPLGGKPVFLHSIDFFRGRREVVEIVFVVAAAECALVRRKYGRILRDRGVVLVEGGRRRQDSAKNGFDVLGGAVDIVAVHDAARHLIQGVLNFRFRHPNSAPLGPRNRQKQQEKPRPTQNHRPNINTVNS